MFFLFIFFSVFFLFSKRQAWREIESAVIGGEKEEENTGGAVQKGQRPVESGAGLSRWSAEVHAFEIDLHSGLHI